MVNGKSQKNVLAVIIVVCVMVILVLLVVIASMLFGLNKKPEKRNIVVTKDNVEQVIEEMQEVEYVEPGYYTVSMSTVWHFATGSSVSVDAYVDNLNENTNDVYFDVFLASDESETIYESPLIPRGATLEEVVLDKSLPAGSHDCVMVYHLVDEEQNTISTLRVGFKIVIEN